MSALCEAVIDTGDEYVPCVNNAQFGIYVGDGISVAVCSFHYYQD